MWLGDGVQAFLESVPQIRSISQGNGQRMAYVPIQGGELLVDRTAMNPHLLIQCFRLRQVSELAMRMRPAELVQHKERTVGAVIISNTDLGPRRSCFELFRIAFATAHA